MNYILRRKQRGLSFTSWLVVIALVGIFVTIFLRIFPVYLEHYSITQSLDAVHALPDIKKISVNEIRSRFSKYLILNGVTSVEPKDLLVQESDTHRVINVAYEVRKPLIGNIDAVIRFSDTRDVQK